MLMWGLFVGAAAAVLAPVGPGALVPLKMAVAAADSVGGDVYVAVVVDFGNGSSMSTLSKCVPVPSNAHDADALAAAVGPSNVSYAASGLLCAIDDYPANGVQNCGQSVGDGNYDYWSYWHGSTGSWVYADNGPAEQSVSSPANDVEGLRFQLNEPDTASSPAPAVVPTYAQICNASTEVPPAGSAPTVTTTTTTQPDPTGSASTPPRPATGVGGVAATRPRPRPAAGQRSHDHDDRTVRWHSEHLHHHRRVDRGSRQQSHPWIIRCAPQRARERGDTSAVPRATCFR